MFIWYIFIFACFLAANPCWGLVKIARISLGVTHELCRQYSEFHETKLVPQTSTKPVSGPIQNLTAEVRWSRCNTPGECLPFRISINTGSPGGRYERIERHPVTEYTYPALIATDKSVFHLDKYVFQGHGVLIDNVTMLTSGSNLLPDNMYHLISMMRFKMGGSDRKKTKTDARWCQQDPHPKWDTKSHSHNFGLIHFRKPILFTENIKPIKFAQPGQEFKGPCRFASWTKSKIKNGLYLYASELLEATVPILPDDVCQKAGLPKTHICTPPLLCGLLDSGAPLICSDNNVDYIYALSSHYMQDYHRPEFCGGRSLSSFSKISEMGWEWVEEAKSRARQNKECNS